jgi:hypothetical protein
MTFLGSHFPENSVLFSKYNKGADFYLAGLVVF